MSVHQLVQHQQIPASLEKVWKFFSSAKNLQTITPEYMNFHVTSGDQPEEIHPGQIITYTVSPVLSIPVFWMTEITQVQPLKMFVDEQRRGPYKMWHHQHHFIEKDGGVFMTDIVHYQLPLGFLRELTRWLFVKRQLENVFAFRTQKVKEIFG
ncbi:MAG: SRPBCC family protein [Chitinophagaceae bacterium]